jgi:hypothetical protein
MVGSRDGWAGPFFEIPATVACAGVAAPDFALVVDNSGSEDGSLDTLQAAAKAFAGQALADGGRVSLVRVASIATVQSALTADVPAIEAAIDGLYICYTDAQGDLNCGWTALYDGIRLGGGTLQDDAASLGFDDAASFALALRRLGIVVFTDGKENNSDYDHEVDPDVFPDDRIDTPLSDVVDLTAGGSVVPLYVVGIGPDVDHEANLEMATLTGGRYLPIEGEGDIAGVFDVIGDYPASVEDVTGALDSVEPGELYAFMDQTKCACSGTCAPKTCRRRFSLSGSPPPAFTSRAPLYSPGAASLGTKNSTYTV